MNKNLSPVLLFAYNRPKHLIKVLNALKNNFLATQTDLIVNCDGKKNKIDKGVDDVKKICESINGFKSVRIIKNKKNTGLAASIIKNVTKEIKKSKKLIILEDDIITSKTFLIYMNSALDYYKNKKNVWHISGHSLFDMRSSKPNGIYLSSYMNCWGWGTWENRWCNFEKNTEIVLEKPVASASDSQLSVLDEFLSDLSGLIRVKQRKNPIEPMLQQQEEHIVRRNMQMIFEQAQIALLREEQKIYQAALQEAQDYLLRFFQSNPASETVSQRLAVLSETGIVQQLPDIYRSLDAIQSLLIIREQRLLEPETPSQLESSQ